VDKQEEVQLARNLLAGEPEAFDRFVEHFRSIVFQYTWLMCGQREDAEEVSQETLLKVFENFDQLREPEHLRAWVFRIAKNVCLMKRRKSVFAPAKELSLDELLPGSGEVADWSRLPDEQVFDAQMKHALHQSIAELPEIYRSVLLLRDLEELSTEETAQVLEIGTAVVKTRLHRARLAVRRKLDEYLHVDAPTEA
jgi:RNA polymerase sigma-70 factor (ECF subfamily)